MSLDAAWAEAEVALRAIAEALPKAGDSMSLHARLQAVRDDHALLVRSVAIRSAYAFGDWPPPFSLSAKGTPAAGVVPTTPVGQVVPFAECGDALWGQPIG